MRYFDSSLISHDICSHEIFRFLCNISWNLQQWDIVILVEYLMTSATILVKYLTKYASISYFDSGVIPREICSHEIFWFWWNISWNLQPWGYFNPGVISHEICNHEIFWFWCNISWNLQPWHIISNEIFNHEMFYHDEISDEILNQEIFWFWCNISWNLQSWESLILL